MLTLFCAWGLHFCGYSFSRPFVCPVRQVRSADRAELSTFCSACRLADKLQLLGGA